MLHKALRAVVEAHGREVALRHEGADLTYAELWRRSDEAAAALRERGVGPGDRVGIVAANSIESVVAQWAIHKCHAIAVYLNDQLRTEELRRILEGCEPALVLRRSVGLSVDFPADLTSPIVDIDALEASGREAGRAFSPDAHPGDDSLIASIIYTSGSTGTPKGVCLTHGNLLSVAKMAADGYRTVPEDRYLMVVPLHYIHGLMILVSMQLRGAGIEFMNSFAFPVAVTRKLRDSGVSGFSGVPYHFAALMDRGGFLEAELPALRWIGITGGTIPPERLRRLREAKPDVEIHISYGQTECSPRITLLAPDRIDEKPDSVGAVADGLHVEFLDDDGLPVAPWETGELVVSGPNVMHGYWNDPVATRRVIDERGRLHTGDLAYIDAAGDIFVKGRKQAMIKSAGERIFPEELESLLNRHPGVADVAIVGVSDPLYGQRVEAHLVLKPEPLEAGTSAERIERIRSFCQSHVPFARAPRRYQVWDEFPLKANGKTDKQQLMADVIDKSG